MDCLVTKLRESVENPSFPIFNEIQVRVQKYSPAFNFFYLSAIEENSPINVWKDGNIVATTSDTNPDGERFNLGDSTGIVEGDYLNLDNINNIRTLANLSVEKEEIMKIVNTISVLYYFNINGIDLLMPILYLMLNLTYINNIKINGRAISFDKNEVITYANAVASQRDSGQCVMGSYTIKFGSSMVNPTEEETTQGWQIV